MSDYSAQFPPEYGQGSYQRHCAEVPPNSGKQQFHSVAGNAPLNQQKRHFGMKLVAYGAKSAFQCRQDQTANGWQTVQFDVAERKQPGSTNKTLDWDSKVQLQILDDELPILVAVLLGLLPDVRFDLHGAANDKWMEIINQGQHFFFKCGMGRRLITAQVTLVDVSMFGLLALNQYTANFPLLTSDSVLTSVRLLAQQLQKSDNYKRAKPHKQ